MNLELVDRRRGAPLAAEAALCAPWGRLTALAATVGPAGWLVNLVLVDDDAMAKLNGDFRGSREPTDVLSFSYLAAGGDGPPDVAAGADGARRDLWLDDVGETASGSGAAVVGEVVIAPDFVTARCRERGWRADWEMPLLVVHGCLHILGWEHDDDADRQAMKACEAAILRGSGLPHPLDEGE